jgi:3'-5' exoribonuclease
MKDFFIRDCSQHENATIVSSFVVASKQIKPKRTGDLYIALTLADRTGQIEAKVWDNVHEFLNSFEQDDFVKVKGLINKFNNKFQLTTSRRRTRMSTRFGARLAISSRVSRTPT